MAKYLIRADATNNEGLGAVSRANCLAQVLRGQGEDVEIVTKAPFGKKFFDTVRFNPVVLPANAGWEKEIEVLNSLKNEDKNTVLILCQTRKIKRYIDNVVPEKVVYINDDLPEEDVPLDLFISSQTVDIPPSSGLKRSIVGPKYHFIKDFVKNLPKVSSYDKVRKILVTMGGSDNKKLTVSVSRFLYEVNSEAEYTILLGICTERVGFTEKRLMGISDDFIINKNASKIVDYLSAFDMAVCKGGVTLYELMHLGVPCVAISTRARQRNLLKFMEEKNVIVYAGHWNEISQDQFKKAVIELNASAERREEISNNARNFIDGKGVLRVSEEIRALF